MSLILNHVFGFVLRFFPVVASTAGPTFPSLPPQAEDGIPDVELDKESCVVQNW